jgi:membrane-associated phospholipid phosphatase
MTIAYVFVLVSILSFPSLGQTNEPDQAPTTGLPTNSPPQPPSPANVARPVSWGRLVPNLLSDQKHIWSFPVRLARGQNWIPTLFVVGTTGGLVALDPTEGSYFHRTQAFQGFNNVFTSNATAYATIAAPVALYVAGLIRKDSKMQQTALFAGEAVVDAEILTTVFKDTTKRMRPAAVPPGGNYSDTWLDSTGPFLRGNGSFPSGHTIAAFSVATVVARRYGNHRWVPYASYGLAALVGFSRLTLSSHFAADVFMGGALGYSISRYTVLR